MNTVLGYFILTCIISIGGLLVVLLLTDTKGDDVFKVFIAIFVLIIILDTFGVIIKSKDLDNTINMKLSNIEFEKQEMANATEEMKNIVNEYVEVEKETINSVDITDKNILVATQIYPELKSNEMFMSLLSMQKQHKENIIHGTKDYNDMLNDRINLNNIPIIGRIIKGVDKEYISE